jgi:hypothetical protein
MIKQTIEYNYYELTQLKKKYELVEWLYGLDLGSADMWKYRQELKQNVKDIISEGFCDDK